MATYRSDDPELDRVMQGLAAETAAVWPPLSEQQRAELAPLLTPPAPPVKTSRRTQVPDRRAA